MSDVNQSYETTECLDPDLESRNERLTVVAASLLGGAIVTGAAVGIDVLQDGTLDNFSSAATLGLGAASLSLLTGMNFMDRADRRRGH